MKIEELRGKLLEFLVEINQYTDEEIQGAIDMLNDITYDITYSK